MVRVYVGNLDPAVSEEDLEDEFCVYGVVRCVWVAKRPPGFGYVEFDESKDALDAISALDGKNGWCVKLDPYSTEGGGGDDLHVGPNGLGNSGRAPEQNTSRKKAKKGLDVETNKSLVQVARDLYISRKKIEKYNDAKPTKINESVAQLSCKIYLSRKNIEKDNGVELTKFEESVAQVFFDLENIIPELKTDLKDLYINSAIKLGVSVDYNAVLIRYPYKLREGFRKIQFNLERELKKKFRGDVVVLVPIRRMVPQLAAAHDVILRDMLFPAEFVGQCGLYNLHHPMAPDSRNQTAYVRKDDPLIPMFVKYFLDPKARNDTEDKLGAFRSVFKFLCGKDVGFGYMVPRD